MLKDRIAVVTGANRGIGLAIARTFAANGAHVFACMRTIDEGAIKHIAQASNHNKVTGVVLDLSDDISIKKAIKEIGLQSVNKIDILVNNAGTASGSLFQMMPLNELRRVFEVNFIGQIMLTQALSRLMTRHGAGSIINIASTAADIADPGTMAYGASKAAFARASKSMATELGSKGVRVNAILPGPTRTDMFYQMSHEARERLIDLAALKRAAEPQDIANMALFLASDLSTFITGQDLRVDGGMV
jgi:3-oxoacyl-[acyl-carrier protein] reductase